MNKSGGLILLALMLTSALALAAGEGAPVLDRTPVEATSAKGDKVLLHPNGRWEFADVKKAEEARKLADQYPENRTRPVEAQGGLMGLGRVIMPGDKDYNRGSLGAKGR